MCSCTQQVHRQINTKGVTLACIAFSIPLLLTHFPSFSGEKRRGDRYSANKTKPVTYTTYFLTDLRRKRFVRIVRCKLNFNFPRRRRIRAQYSSTYYATNCFHAKQSIESTIDPKKHPLTDTR